MEIFSRAVEPGVWLVDSLPMRRSCPFCEISAQCLELECSEILADMAAWDGLPDNGQRLEGDRPKSSVGSLLMVKALFRARSRVQ